MFDKMKIHLIYKWFEWWLGLMKMSFHMSFELVRIHLLDYKEKAYLCRALHTLHIHFFIKLEVFLWGAIFMPFSSTNIFKLYRIHIILTKNIIIIPRKSRENSGEIWKSKEIKTQGKLLFCNPAGYLINPKFIQSSKELQV